MIMKNPLDPPKELQTIAKTELNEVPARVTEDIQHIRIWLFKQPHLKVRTDDLTLLIFLRSCKFSLEKTKKKIELFYTAKTAFQDVFKNRDPFQPTIQYILQNRVISILPNFSNGPTLILMRLENLFPDVAPINDILKLTLMTLEVILREYASCSIAGQALLLDLKNFSMKYLTYMTPTFVKKFITCSMTAVPVRIKEIHYINVEPIFLPIWKVVRSLLSEKLRDRVFLYTNNGSGRIERLFSPSVLPTEYGGTAGSLDSLCAQLKFKIENYHEWFLDDEQYGCITERRPSSANLDSEIFALNGSFRKLELD